MFLIYFLFIKNTNSIQKENSPLRGERKILFLANFGESAVESELLPTDTIGGFHRNLIVDAGCPGVLVTERPPGIVPTLRVDEILRLDIGDDNRTEIGRLFQVNVTFVEHLEHHGDNRRAHVAHLYRSCHNSPSRVFTLGPTCLYLMMRRRYKVSHCL